MITGVSTFLVVLIFGSIGFYYLDVKHFGIDFTWKQSIGYAIRTFGLINNADLHPLTRFGKRISFIYKRAWELVHGYFFFILIIRPTIHKANNIEQNPFRTAQYLLKQYGDSPLDYFKISTDKLAIYF